jgi:hypothetical protein
MGIERERGKGSGGEVVYIQSMKYFTNVSI